MKTRKFQLTKALKMLLLKLGNMLSNSEKDHLMPEWPKDRLTRFEVARIIGARALQVSLGAPLLIKMDKEDIDPIDIAEKEFKDVKIPMTIKRPMPDDSKVVVDIKDAVKKWLTEHNNSIF